MAKRTSVTKSAFKGVNNKKAPERLDDSELAECKNMDIDDTGKLSTRKGREKVLSGDDYHSLWSPPSKDYALGIKGDKLVKITRNNDETYSESTLRSGLTRGKAMSFAWAVDDVYYMNGAQKGVLLNGATDSDWGIPQATPPALASTTGALNPGRYQITATFVDTNGLEGGAVQGSSITLSTTGGISITNIPSASGMDKVRLYTTGPGGTRYYRFAELSNGTSSHTLQTGLHWTIELQTFLNIQPPVGSVIGFDNGRIFIAQGNILWFTRPYSLHLVDPETSFFQFPADITFLQVQPESGLVIGADQTYWVPSGFTDPAQVPLRTLAPYKPFGTTGQIIDGKDIGNGLIGKYSIWPSEQGICIIGPGGNNFQNLTEQQYEPPAGGQAAMLVREFNGYTQALALLRVVSGGQNVHVSDEMNATVRKNSVA